MGQSWCTVAGLVVVELISYIWSTASGRPTIVSYFAQVSIKGLLDTLVGAYFYSINVK